MPCNSSLSRESQMEGYPGHVQPYRDRDKRGKINGQLWSRSVGIRQRVLPTSVMEGCQALIVGVRVITVDPVGREEDASRHGPSRRVSAANGSKTANKRGCAVELSMDKRLAQSLRDEVRSLISAGQDLCRLLAGSCGPRCRCVSRLEMTIPACMHNAKPVYRSSWDASDDSLRFPLSQLAA